MATDVIYTASDLKERRTEVLEAAHRRAVVRAVDGTALLFLPMATVERAEAVAHWAMALHELSDLDRSAFPWLRHLDDDDRAEFVDDALRALRDVNAGGSIEEFERVIAEWRVTALSVSDSARRSVLLGDVTEDDFELVTRPDGSA